MDIQKEICLQLENFGFKTEDAVYATQEIYASAIEDTYNELCTKDELKQLEMLVEAKDRTKIFEFHEQMDQDMCTKALCKNIEKYLSILFKNIVDNCPSALLEDLQMRLQKMANINVINDIKNLDAQEVFKLLTKDLIDKPQATVQSRQAQS
jgi:uncharacterized protein YpbB